MITYTFMRPPRLESRSFCLQGDLLLSSLVDFSIQETCPLIPLIRSQDPSRIWFCKTYNKLKNTSSSLFHSFNRIKMIQLTCPPARVEFLITLDTWLKIIIAFSTTEAAKASLFSSSVLTFNVELPTEPINQFINHFRSKNIIDTTWN